MSTRHRRSYRNMASQIGRALEALGHINEGRVANERVRVPLRILLRRARAALGDAQTLLRYVEDVASRRAAQADG